MAKKTSDKTQMGATGLRKGDMVMVISGGNKKKRPLKGQVGKILGFADDARQRAIVEGLNIVTKHQKAKGPGTTSARIKKEAPMHVSRLMFYAEKIKRPVRISYKLEKDGTKIRGYKDPKSKEFVQIGA